MGSEWKRIDDEPDHPGPMRVLLYIPGAACAAFDGCDYSIQLGMWDRTKHADIFSGWFEQGTNHDFFEPLSDPRNHPTHWQPAPEPPLPEFDGTEGDITQFE